MLPWVELDSATFRTNRRRSHRLDDGRVGFVTEGGDRSDRVLLLARGRAHQLGLTRAPSPHSAGSAPGAGSTRTRSASTAGR